jgi:hypothetical protein
MCCWWYVWWCWEFLRWGKQWWTKVIRWSDELSNDGFVLRVRCTGLSHTTKLDSYFANGDTDGTGDDGVCIRSRTRIVANKVSRLISSLSMLQIVRLCHHRLQRKSKRLTLKTGSFNLVQLVLEKLLICFPPNNSNFNAQRFHRSLSFFLSTFLQSTHQL